MSKLFSVIILICLSPLLIIIALAIILDDGFPIFFRQKRIGINNDEFWIYKFRTMKKETPDIPTYLVKEAQNYYTIIGPILRKLSIDELPQLINILKGEMVLVDPRPALYNQGDLIKLRTEKGIHKLVPGVTGWAQINGRDNLSISEKVELDEYYLKNNWLITIPKIAVKALYRLGKFIDNAFIKENAIKLISDNIFSLEKIKFHIKLDATINDI